MAASAAAVALPAAAPRPWLGVVAVLVGAVATTMTSRETSTGLADLEGAIGAGVDEGAWITTAFTVAQMMVGPVTVWFGRTAGPRPILMLGALLYGLTNLLLPLSPDLRTVLVLQFISGLGSGVFIPSTVGFIANSLPRAIWPLGIAAYALNISLGLNVSSTLEGWYAEHMTWRWIFWQNSLLAIPLMALYGYGMPKARFDKTLLRSGDYTGMSFAAGGLCLLYAAMDQGDRLQWFDSVVIQVLVLGGAAMLGIFLVYETITPRAGINFTVLARNNVFKLLILIVAVRFLVVSSNVLVTNFLAVVRDLRPLEIGNALIWVSLPQLLFAPLVGYMLLRIHPKWGIAAGLAIIMTACLIAAQVTSIWSERNFVLPLTIQAFGQALAITSTVFFLVTHITPEDALVFGALVQTARLFGGEIAITVLNVFSRMSEQRASNLIGQHAGAADPSTISRLDAYTEQFVALSQGAGTAGERALAALTGAVRGQAYTMAYADAFYLAAVIALTGCAIGLSLKRNP